MPAIFLDRDGVINRNRADHVKSWAEFEFLPGSLVALAELHRAGYQIFVITNQAIINRGMLSATQLNLIHQQMKEQVEGAGGRIEAVLYCPHRPAENCSCRKPRPGLIRQVETRFGVQAAGSWLIGDHTNDIEAGEQAGCRPLLVLTGRGRDSYPSCRAKPGLLVAADLAEGVKMILSLSAEAFTMVAHPGSSFPG